MKPFSIALPPAIAGVAVKLKPSSVHAAFLHMAVVVFALDALASVWPAFASWWESRFHFMVAIAVLVDAWANHLDVFNRHAEIARLKEEHETREAEIAALKLERAAKRPRVRRSSTT